MIWNVLNKFSYFVAAYTFFCQALKLRNILKELSTVSFTNLDQCTKIIIFELILAAFFEYAGVEAKSLQLKIEPPWENPACINW